MVINNKRNEMVRFDSIKEGEVFILYGEDVCIKIEAVEDSYAEVYHAVKLANGELIVCNNDLMVCKVKCELVIE